MLCGKFKSEVFVLSVICVYYKSCRHYRHSSVYSQVCVLDVIPNTPHTPGSNYVKIGSFGVIDTRSVFHDFY